MKVRVIDVCLHPEELVLLGDALVRVASEAEALVVRHSSPGLYFALKTENEESQGAATWHSPAGRHVEREQVSTAGKEVNRTR